MSKNTIQRFIVNQIYKIASKLKILGYQWQVSEMQEQELVSMISRICRNQRMIGNPQKYKHRWNLLTMVRMRITNITNVLHLSQFNLMNQKMIQLMRISCKHFHQKKTHI
jgi:hypothetical protein